VQVERADSAHFAHDQIGAPTIAREAAELAD
jgi:hypothetical protein